MFTSVWIYISGHACIPCWCVAFTMVWYLCFTSFVLWNMVLAFRIWYAKSRIMCCYPESVKFDRKSYSICLGAHCVKYVVLCGLVLSLIVTYKTGICWLYLMLTLSWCHFKGVGNIHEYFTPVVLWEMFVNLEVFMYAWTNENWPC